jgi:hypothetical protein
MDPTDRWRTCENIAAYVRNKPEGAATFDQLREHWSPLVISIAVERGYIRPAGLLDGELLYKSPEVRQ